MAIALFMLAAPFAGGAEPAKGGPSAAGMFRLVGEDDTGGHYFSQVIYAPTAQAVVTWGTRTHSKPIRAHETQHFLPGENRWVDAWPAGKEQAWAGTFRTWPDWNICAPVGEFYTRDGVAMPRPNSSFYQVCWDAHNKRMIFYVGSMTFSYRPDTRTWKQIHAPTAANQPPAMLVWSSLCYDPVNRQVLLFGGGGIAAKDGRPHTWAMDVTTDRWRRLELDVEPPARCNSRMVYVPAHKAIVLFGGDGQDRGLADTWVFDCVRQRWQQKNPARHPHPRSCHALATLEPSGLVLLVGGYPVCDYRQRDKLSRQAWVYDVGKDTWTQLDVAVPKFRWASAAALPERDEIVLVTAGPYDHSRKTYRFRYSADIAAVAPKDKPAPLEAPATHRTLAWYKDVPAADRKAHEKLLAELSPNQWVSMKPPKSCQGRTWGTAIFDSELGLALKWGGGHSGYQGTDMAIYDLSANRFAIDRAPAITPWPFDRWARRPRGRTFFQQPWTRHMRHTCAYDPVAKVGVFSDVGGSEWYDRKTGRFVKKTWLYDARKRKWLEPIDQPFPGGGSRSPIAVTTPDGVVVYQLGKMFRFAAAKDPKADPRFAWKEIPIAGPQRPRQHEHMTIVCDTKRDRLIFLSADPKSEGAGWGRSGDSRPRLWFFDRKTRRWQANPKPADGGIITREAVYVPGQDAVLAYGPARRDDPVWTRVYLCAENRWLALPIKTPQFIVHEVGLVFDPKRSLAVLMWPPRFEQDMQPHVFRLDVGELSR